MRLFLTLFTTYIVIMLVGVMALTSCSEENPEVAAQAFLQKARKASEEQQYAYAHELIDSLRTLYPKAIDTRWEALTFEDSLNLTEAKLNAEFTSEMLSSAQRVVNLLTEEGLSELDPVRKLAQQRLDSARMEHERCYMRVRFYTRKLENTSKQKSGGAK